MVYCASYHNVVSHMDNYHPKLTISKRNEEFLLFLGKGNGSMDG